MWKIFVVVILLLIALSVFVIRPTYTDEHTGEKKRATSMGIIPLVLAVLFIALNSFTQVHAREEGVGVAFGKPVSSYSAGPHFKPFWESVTKINEAVYTDSYGAKEEDSAAALPVRLGDGNTASLASTIRWHVNPEAAQIIYATYRSDDPADQLRKSVVDTQYQAVVNNVAGQFNPTSVVQDLNLKNLSTATRALNFSPDYKQMAVDITNQMNEAVKDADGLPLVIIDKVSVIGIAYGDATEENISSIQAQAAKTQQAFLLKGTNTILAEANNKLKSSLAGQDAPAIIAQQCFRDLADGKIQNEPGFSCWPGSGSGVIIPGTK